jgi:hypothetical protein
MATVQAYAKDLVLQIERAFHGVERPQITLRVARRADDNRWDELPQLQKFDDHYGSWNEIPKDDIEKFQDVFCWLCPIGFRFYLPAFMIHSLRHSPQLVNNVWLQSAFSDESNLEFLDLSQKKAVWRFLIAALESVHDDYHSDWWNHPWDKEWAEDSEKEEVWLMLGKAFTLLRDHVGQDLGHSNAKQDV